MLVASGQRVRLNEAGINFFRVGAGAPRRRQWEWRDRVGVVRALTKDGTQARIIWEGNRVQSDPIPVSFLVCIDATVKEAGKL